MSENNYCYLCQEPESVVGHETQSCPHVKCKKCGLKGHVQGNCPNLNFIIDQKPDCNVIVLNNDAKLLDFVKDIEFSSEVKPKFDVKEEKLKIESPEIYQKPGMVDSKMPNDKEIMDFVHDIEFSNDIKLKLEVKKEPMDTKSNFDDIKIKSEVKEETLKVMSSKIDLQGPDIKVYLVDPIASNEKEIIDFVHDIEFSNNFKPKLEIKDEPTDMESRVVEQPIRNEKVFHDLDMNNKQVHFEQVAIQNEEQWLVNIELRKSKFDKVELKNFRLSACDKNEAKNIGLLYNLPGVQVPSMLRKKAEKAEPRIE